jgi:hypothetical protein
MEGTGMPETQSKTATFTKEPWKQESTQLSICRFIVSIEDVNCEEISADGITIAYVPTDYETDTQKANARLIVAAPELLKEGKRLVAWLDKCAAQSEGQAKDSTFISLAEASAADAKNFRATAKAMREIIAKAEGR